MSSGRRATTAFLAAFALAYTVTGFLPGRIFAPLDIPRDFAAWKSDAQSRVRVSNSLLSDVAVQFDVWDLAVRRHISAGEAPWVNEFSGEGAPLFANPQTAILSPFTWPRLLLGERGWVLTAFAKLFCAAAGAAWLCRVLGGTEAEAALSGVIYAGSGAFITSLLFPHTNVLAWLPSLVAACLELLRHPSRRHAVEVIAFSALATAGGHPETLFVGVLGAAAFVGWETFGASSIEQRPGSRDAARVAFAALAGFLILAIQIVPFLSILADAYARTARASMWVPSFRWPMLPALALPGYLGSPLRGELDLTALLPQLVNFSQRSIAFIGFIALLVIAMSYRDLGRSFRRGLALAAIALVLALQPPLIRTILQAIPVVNWSATDYFAYLFVLFAAVAAGPAASIVAATPRPKTAWILGSAAAILALAGVIVALPVAQRMLTNAASEVVGLLRQRHLLRQSPAVYQARLAGYLVAARMTALRRIALPAICWLAAAIALKGRRPLLLGTAMIAELLIFGIGFNPAIDRREVAPEPSVVRALHYLDPRHEFLIAANFATFPANLGTRYDVRDVVAYDVLESRERVAALKGAGYDPLLHTLPEAPTANELDELARLGVRFFLTQPPVGGPARAGTTDAVSIQELPGAIPSPLPQNTTPQGFIAGCAVSALALIVAALISMRMRA